MHTFKWDVNVAHISEMIYVQGSENLHCCTFRMKSRGNEFYFQIPFH